MRRLIAAALIVGMTAGYAFAARVLPHGDNPGEIIQAHVGDYTKSRCDTYTVTKGIFANISTENGERPYLAVSWWATDSSGNPVMVKRYLGTNSAYVPTNEKVDIIAVNGQRAQYPKLAYGAYSAAARSITLCSER